MRRVPYGSKKSEVSIAAAALALLGNCNLATAQEGETVALETVVVTATKRTENLQEVPVAVSAITSQELESRGIAETSDLMGSLPNLQVTSAYGRTQPNFALRGISVTNEFSAATTSPVGVYVDEVYQSFRASHGQQLYDLEQVEVVRGPQGTLFGRNTTGGAVSFYSKKPRLDGFDSYVTLGAGNYDAREASAALEVTPIQDVLGIRFAGTVAEADGYTFNPADGRDYSETDSKAARLVARYKPTDRLDTTFKVYWARNEPLQDLPYGIGYLDNGMTGSGYTRNGVQPTLGRPLRENEVEADTAGTYFTESKGVALNLQYELSDNITLTSISGFDNGKYRLSPFDCDGSPLNVCAIRYNSESDNFNQDLRVSFNMDRFKVIGGIYYGKDKIDTLNQPDFFNFLQPVLQGLGIPGNFANIPVASLDSLSVLPAFVLNPALTPSDPGFCAPVSAAATPGRGPGFFDARLLQAVQYDYNMTNSAAPGAAQAACLAAGALPFTGITVDQTFTIERPSLAIYGEGKWDMTDRTALTLGLRLTRDEVRFLNARSVARDLGGTQVVGLVPYTFPFDPSQPGVSRSETTEEFTGRAIFDFKPADDVLTYLSYSHGYRAGTYNSLAYQDIDQVYFVEPEEVDAIEVGVKTRFFGNRLQLNAAAFYYDYKNQQIAEIVGATSFLRMANGEVKGAEAELVAQVTRSLRIDATLGLLDTRYDDNQRFTPTGLDIGGNEFPNAPNTTANLGFTWQAWSNSTGALTLRGEAQYMGGYWFDPFNDYGQSAAQVNGRLATRELAGRNPSYELYNARLSYDMNKLSISAWAKNLTDKFYWVYGLNLNAFRQDYFTRGTPRTYGMEATYRF